MAQVSRLTAEQRADLVAYLDGELDEASAATIEQMLANSAVARLEVELLGRAWSMLDVLPRESASAEFTARTLEKLQAPTATRDRKDYSAGLNAALLGFGWGSLLLSALLIGYGIGQRWLSREEQAIIEQLPVLRNLDKYQNVGDVEFLDRLAQSGISFPERGDRR